MRTDYQSRFLKKFEKKVGFTAVNIEKGVVPGKDGALTWIGKLEAKSPG